MLDGSPLKEDPLKLTLRIVAVPLLISVAVTLLRLAGELGHWSIAWFSPATGWIIPSGWSWVVGITWLPALFGPYFAYRLWVAGHRPPNLIRPLGFALLGAAIFVFGMQVMRPRVSTSTAGPLWLVAIWVLSVVAAGLQAFGWRKLAGTLLVYGLGSRAVVAIVMFLALAFNWGTHYDGHPLRLRRTAGAPAAAIRHTHRLARSLPTAGVLGRVHDPARVPGRCCHRPLPGCPGGDGTGLTHRTPSNHGRYGLVGPVRSCGSRGMRPWCWHTVPRGGVLLLSASRRATTSCASP